MIICKEDGLKEIKLQTGQSWVFSYADISTFWPRISQNTDEIKATIRGAC
jgi:hypothetical protein